MTRKSMKIGLAAMAGPLGLAMLLLQPVVGGSGAQAQMSPEAEWKKTVAARQQGRRVGSAGTAVADPTRLFERELAEGISQDQITFDVDAAAESGCSVSRPNATPANFCGTAPVPVR